MQSKTFLKTFLLFFQILFISTSIVVENNQDLLTTLNLFANEIAEIKNNVVHIQSKVMSKAFDNFPKYTILTVGSEEIFNYFTIRYF
jgi:hypothetical protein